MQSSLVQNRKWASYLTKEDNNKQKANILKLHKKKKTDEKGKDKTEKKKIKQIIFDFIQIL